MKARMKKLISIKSIPILALALLIVLGTALAESEGDSVTGSGSVAVNPDTGLFEGTATLSIEGEKFEGSVTVIPAGGMFPRPDGGWDFPGVIHEFVFEDGSFTTKGDEVAKPTDVEDVFVLDGDMNIIEGTGDFEDASGEMNPHGKLDMRGLPSASFKVNGTISR